MKNKCCFVVIVLLLLSNACKKDTVNVFTSSSYPLAVGNWWQYEVYSTFYGTDTFTMRVDSIINGSPFTKYVCNYIGNGTTTPAGYFLQSDTSMSFIQPYGYFTSFPSFYLKFPVAAGRYWQGAFPGDSILVDAVVGSEGFYSHTYGPCYLTNESYDLPHNYKVCNTALTPKIGLIHQSLNFNSDTADKSSSYSGGVQINQSISLINYHVQ
jgi:hypothetical protein